MQPTPQTDRYLHQKLPIDADEKILAVYKHHWFAYAASWAIGILVALLIIGAATVLSFAGGNDSVFVAHRSQLLALAAIFALVVLAGSSIPVYLRSQEHLVLTEEAILQILQPSLFASKIDQLGLQHVADVSVQQDFFGTLLGFGQIIIETPGEQDNYKFVIVPDPHSAAREIIHAHENYNAALMGGRMPSNLSAQTPPLMPALDMKQYQQFLAYQQMLAQQQNQTAPAPEQGQQAAQPNDPTKQYQ